MEFEELTVKDHLEALGHNEVWMNTLAEMIIEFTNNDVAIAASRAMDLGTHGRFGKSVAFMIKGYLEITNELKEGLDLTPNQRETMRQLLKGTTIRMLEFFPELVGDLKERLNLDAEQTKTFDRYFSDTGR